MRKRQAPSKQTQFRGLRGRSSPERFVPSMQCSRDAFQHASIEVRKPPERYKRSLGGVAHTICLVRFHASLRPRRCRGGRALHSRPFSLWRRAPDSTTRTSRCAPLAAREKVNSRSSSAPAARRAIGTFSKPLRTPCALRFQSVERKAMCTVISKRSLSRYRGPRSRHTNREFGHLIDHLCKEYATLRIAHSLRT